MTQTLATMGGLPSPLAAPKAWSDHNVFWRDCPTLNECTAANVCRFRSAAISRRGFLAAGALLPGWLSTTGGKLLVPPHSPISRQFFFLNSYTGEASMNGGAPMPQPIEMPHPNEWLEIDMATLGVPKDAVAVMVGAILIITNGETGGACDLAFSLKAPSSDNTPNNYCGQALAVGLSGARTNMQAVCPVEDGRIHIAWLRGSYDEWPDKPLAQQWPQGASYGINATIEMVMLR